MRTLKALLYVSLVLTLVAICFIPEAYPDTKRIWEIANPWVIGDYWNFPEDIYSYSGGVTDSGGKKTFMEALGFPAIVPITVAPLEVQYGTIALLLIMGGSVIYYLRKPRGARELWKAQDRKAPSRSRSKNPKPSKNSEKIRRGLNKKRRKPKKW